MERLFTKMFAFVAILSLSFSLSAQEVMTFNVNSPVSIEGDYPVGIPGASFITHLEPGESITGDLVWAFGLVDSLVCDTVINADEVAGNFSLVRRGDCFFMDKVWHSQTAGATATVICNNNPGEGVIPFASGGDFEGLDTIPSAFLSYETCELIAEVLAAGETVNVTIAVPEFYSAIGAYSYHTPESQIIPLDAMGVNLVNSTSDMLPATVTVTITEPDGDVVVLEESADLMPAQDSAFVFDAYTPDGGKGTYEMVFTNSFTDDSFELPFVITDFTFAPDNGMILDGTGPSDDDFVNTFGLRYQTGSLVITGEDPAVATFATFGLENAAAIFTGDPTADIFSFVLYDGDQDDDDVIDLTASFEEDLNAVAIGTYVLTGEEGENELITIPLESLTGDAIELIADQPYYITVNYDGANAGTGIAPQLTSTQDTPYPIGLTTPLLLDQLYTGWAGRTIVTRLHLDGFGVSKTNDLSPLDDSKLTLAPNPAKDFTTITFELDEVADEVFVGILDFNGKLVKEYRYENVLNETFNYDVTDLAAGTYFFSIVTPEGYKPAKFVVVK